MEVCEDKFTMEEITKDYLKEIDKIPLLTPSEEIELGKRILDGDEKAIKTLAFHNLRLSVSIAKRYAPICNRHFLDVCQDGSLGLIKAAEEFDYRKGRFSTNATRWIRQSIFREKENTDDMIRKPSKFCHFKNEVNSVERSLVHTLGRNPNYLDIANEMNVDVKEIEFVFNAFSSVLSLNTPVEEEDNLFETVQDENVPPLDTQILWEEQKQMLFEAISFLDEREQFILINHWGLNGKEKMSQRELAKVLNITQSRVGQIEKKALKKLKIKLKKQNIGFQKQYTL